MLTHTRFQRYSTTGVIGEANDAQTGDGEASYDGTIAITTTQEVSLAFLFAKVKSFCAYVEGGSLTLKTNSSGAPDDTLVLPVGLTVWNANDAAACPFTTDVTKFFLVNASGTATPTAKIRVLLDVTP